MEGANEQIGRTEVDHVPLRAEAVASKTAIAGHPIHPMLIPFPIAFLTFALVPDAAYAATGDGFFARMALWMVSVGLLSGAVAAVPGLADFVTLERARSVRSGWVHAIGNGAVLVLATLNLGGRVVRGAEEFIVPWGLVLSALAGLGLAVTGWAGGELSYRHLVGADPRVSRRRAADAHAPRMRLPGRRTGRGRR